MKNTNLITFILLLCSFCSFQTHAQTWKWAKGSNCPHSVIESWPIAVDHAGNVYESGIPSSSSIPSDSITCIFDNDTVHSPNSIVIVSTDSNGNYRWAIGATSGFAEAWNIVTDMHNNLYLFGMFWGSLNLGGHTITGGGGNSAFCAKMDSYGNVIWLKELGDSSYCAGDVDGHGNVYVGGHFTGAHCVVGGTTLTNSRYDGISSDMFVAKLDTNGGLLWVQHFGGDSSEYVQGVAVTYNGIVTVSGNFSSTVLHIGSNTLTYPYSEPDNTNMFLMNLDTWGNVQWAKQINAPAVHTLNGMTIDPWDNIYLTGGYMKNLYFGIDSLVRTNSFLMFVAKYDKNGNEKWASTVDNWSYTQGWSVAADACGNIWVSGGRPLGWAPGSDPMYVFEFDSTGALFDSVMLSSGGDDQNCVIVDNKGNLYVGGDYYEANFVVGNDTLHITDSTNETLFLAKYKYPFCMVSPTLETSTQNLADMKIVLYPNPAREECTIETNNATAISKIEIYDITGRVLQVENPNRTKATFSISHLKPGIYSCKVYTVDNGVFYQKLVID
jgi:Secretion system C-terminal sorting domain